jgi:hypothetical protein
MGMYSAGDTLRTVLNVITPIVLIALGFIMPEIRKKEDEKEAK